MLQGNMAQDELETRLRLFHFQHDPTDNKTIEGTPTSGKSYRDAVGGTEKDASTKEGMAPTDQKKWYDMCMKPAEPVRELRERTEEENQALVMILNHQLEVPVPPRFLVLSMTVVELAAFTDIFMALEYPLYAHLAPGQRYGTGLGKQSIMQMIQVGAEAALPQKQEIAEFKAAIARIEIDPERRLVIVTFKGKRSAQKWVGWKMPMGMRMLPLRDYEQQREEAQRSNKLVPLDLYTFTAAVRKGALTSADMFWLLTVRLDLEVKTMAHVEIEGAGINDKQWTVTIAASACPVEMRQMVYIMIGDSIVQFHHHTVFVNWPCVLCGAPEHPTKYCRTAVEQQQRKKVEHTRTIEAQFPSQRGTSGRTYRSAKHPTTLAQLMAKIQSELQAAHESVAEVKKRIEPPETPHITKKHNGTAAREDRPKLPGHWEQIRRRHHEATGSPSPTMRVHSEQAGGKSNSEEERGEGPPHCTHGNAGRCTAIRPRQ